MAEHLEQLTKIFKELSLLAEKQKRNMQVYQKKALQLTIAYLVFQAIAFISITKQAYYSSSVGYQLDLNLMEQEIVSKQIREAERCIK
ncbi:hypothetical protein ES288_A12G286700v1 [Gossypium darwinii]|uniref:Uncharacterized protein n=1 Tax=Gossypium darwinii TaxID=34276 RepID=A0A5D2EE24_GOSDA|nr:hypothetical protein ES288_A12G286700v1 [Gossypium darwinii]